MGQSNDSANKSDIQAFTYSLEDFDTIAPYDYVLDIKDEFTRDVTARALEKYARSMGFKSFLKSLEARRKSRKRALVPADDGSPKIGSFEQAEMDYFLGKWETDSSGVYRYGPDGSKDFACTHPIFPTERLRNIDTGELKVRLRWTRDNENRKTWHDVLSSFDTVANAKNILQLANLGVSVASGRRAQSLVDYLTDILDLNYGRISERKSVSRLGWNEEGFSPYIGDVEFDGSESFGRAFAAIRQHGSEEKWLEEVRAVRAYSLLARIVLASSFASVLVDPMGCLPFFVHLWGMDSGTGKTVAQMVAASVWGEPTPGGEYFKTFRSTTVGFEVLAGFFRSLPIVIDELQLAKDKNGKVIFNVYELAAGSGKMRSNVKLGIAATPKWANCFISSGETPITSEQDGAGALNRVIEIECLASNKIIENGHRTADTLKRNYGHAGKAFVEILCADGIMDYAKGRYSELFQVYTKGQATEKQAHSAALITLADELATKWIFKDGRNITVEELSGFLRSREAISAADRGYEYMCDWVASNANRFTGKNEIGDIFGRFPNDGSEHNDAGYVYIIRSVFNNACAEAGISAKALLSHLRSNRLIKTKEKGFTVGKRIGSVVPDCVIMKLQKDDFTDLDSENCNFPI